MTALLTRWRQHFHVVSLFQDATFVDAPLRHSDPLHLGAGLPLDKRLLALLGRALVLPFLLNREQDPVYPLPQPAEDERRGRHVGAEVLQRGRGLPRPRAQRRVDVRKDFAVEVSLPGHVPEQPLTRR